MKKISFANVLFWILWVFLFLISALVLIGEFYFSRLFLLALLVFLPVLLRKKLFKRILLSLPLWLGIFLFFVVIVVVTDKTGNDQNLKGMTVVKQEGVTLTLLEGTIPENEKAIIKKDGKAMLPGEGSIMFESYDISLSEGC
ncbi:MAG TPA: hypothetical protein P5127_06170, partial [Oscillospiraceae bacterium]|nr:hypothetical protein [Oscillospiraceae bacterium]